MAKPFAETLTDSSSSKGSQLEASCEKPAADCILAEPPDYFNDSLLRNVDDGEKNKFTGDSVAMAGDFEHRKNCLKILGEFRVVTIREGDGKNYFKLKQESEGASSAWPQ
ncbi:hypothetical protein Anapl_01515 [Anas platyrhynchos]|uniref:Uncharacterized protein n=1 Tax=Anas platyrhynchos TaxID=8839 RepID=R0M2G5_ANAPL|nr:hypothetical protein Anapl_01515 [Anas platyrhynchos]